MDTPTKKRCNKCTKVKPLEEFKKCALANDGYSGHCRACAPAPAKRAPKEPEHAVEEGNGPMLRCEPSIGFAAQRQGADIVIEQESAEGISAIWLSLAEAELLESWLARLRAEELTSAEPEAA